MKRMRLGRRNEPLVRDFRNIKRDRDALQAKLEAAQATIVGLTADLDGATLVAIRTKKRISPNSFCDVGFTYCMGARLKRLNAIRRLDDLGPVTEICHTFSPFLEQDHARQMKQEVWVHLGRKVLEKIVENSPDMQ